MWFYFVRAWGSLMSNSQLEDGECLALHLKRLYAWSIRVTSRVLIHQQDAHCYHCAGICVLRCQSCKTACIAAQGGTSNRFRNARGSWSGQPADWTTFPNDSPCLVELPVWPSVQHSWPSAHPPICSCSQRQLSVHVCKFPYASTGSWR